MEKIEREAVAVNESEDLPVSGLSSDEVLAEKAAGHVNIVKEKVGKSLHALPLSAPSMLDVALDCGFGSERNFYRIFKAHTGYSPKVYASKKVSTQPQIYL